MICSNFKTKPQKNDFAATMKSMDGFTACNACRLMFIADCRKQGADKCCSKASRMICSSTWKYSVLQELAAQVAAQIAARIAAQAVQCSAFACWLACKYKLVYATPHIDMFRRVS